MALYWRGLYAITFTSEYTKSSAMSFGASADTNRVVVAHYVRENPYIRYGSPPTYAGVPFTQLDGTLSDTWFGYPQIGISSSGECTGEMFYLLNPATGTNNLIMYQGVQGDAATVQNLHCIMVEVTASAGASIELETFTGSFDTTPPDGLWPKIISTASLGSFAMAAMGHDRNDIVVSLPSNWTNVTSSDFGLYTAYWQETIMTSSTEPLSFYWRLNSSLNYNIMFVAFKEVWPERTTYVQFLDDEQALY